MSKSTWTEDKWTAFASAKVEGKPTERVFESREVNNQLDVKNITVRESCDSELYPNSTPVIAALDVTGSMDMLADHMARKGLPIFITELYGKKPVSDPQLMIMGIGDVKYDEAPLQATQFEVDIKIADQLLKLWLEKGGGPNRFESYIAVWYFAAFKTRIDSFIKRGKKGVLFTIGDEFPTPSLSRSDIKSMFGDAMQQEEWTAEALLAAVRKYYHVYHIIVAEGSCCKNNLPEVEEEWRALLGQDAVTLEDHTKLSELMVSIMQLHAGVTLDEVVKGWDGSTGMVVSSSLASMGSSIATRQAAESALATGESAGGVMRF